MSWRIDPARTALLVIDVQERLLPAMAGGAAVVKRTCDAVKIARIFGMPIFRTEQAPDKLGSTAALILEALGQDAPPARLKLEFSKAGCFGPDELPPILLVAGIETHVCVRQSVFDLRERGHSVYILADAVASRSEGDHRLALHELREVAQARVTTLEAVTWEMLGSVENTHFKKVLAILK